MQHEATRFLTLMSFCCRKIIFHEKHLHYTKIYPFLGTCNYKNNRYFCYMSNFLQKDNVFCILMEWLQQKVNKFER